MPRGTDVGKKCRENFSLHEGSIIMDADLFGVAQIRTPSNSIPSGVGYFGLDPSGVVEDKYTGKFDNPLYY